jgi:ribosomal protein L37AE/L43A
MANYSKDMERQNKALKDLLSGKEYEKDYVQVGYEGKKDNRGGETRESELSKVMQSVRMPLFCPNCKKAMKKKLDDKFWRTKGHCFDCQIEFENKLKVKGEFDDYAKNIINGNKKAYLKDLKQSLVEFEETGGKVEWLNDVGALTPELEKEKWEMGETEFAKVVDEAKQYITKLEKAIEDESKELNPTREDSN